MEGRFTSGDGGRLALDGEPRLVAPALLPEHRLLRIRVRNEGHRAVELGRDDLRLTDAAANDLRASVTPPRLRIEPGQSATLDFVYRGDEPPAYAGPVALGAPVSAPAS